jgi:hypothetical protein
MIQFLRPYPCLLRFPQGHPIAHATDVTGRSDVVLNLKEKNLFLFLDLLRMAAEVLTMCCFFGAAWVRLCCIGMIRAMRPDEY